MKQISSLIISIFLTMTTIAQTNDTKDDTQIRGLVKTIENGWSAKDGKLFAQPFSENADYVVVNGMHLKGRVAIAEGHQRIFDSFYKETNIKAEVKSIRFIRKDVAIAHVTSHMTGVSNNQQVDTRSLITLTIEKTPEGWQVAAFQNTQVTMPGGN